MLAVQVSEFVVGYINSTGMADVSQKRCHLVAQGTSDLVMFEQTLGPKYVS
jgi:hypothetical protein